MLAKVLYKSANQFVVFLFENKKTEKCLIYKKIKSKNTILVGDIVDVVYENNNFVIQNIIERKNILIRPKVSNIDYIFIIHSVKEPNFNSFLLNKFLAFYEYKNVENIIIYFSKLDLLNNQELTNIKKIIKNYQNDGYIVFNNLEINHSLSFINKIIQNNTICFVGESGVGKSTFINKLIPNLSLKTQEISKVLNRGKNTTTNSLIFNFKNGFIIDTPGFSSFDLNLNKFELSKTFKDFKKYKNYCKFSDCLHEFEQNCFIKEMVKKNKIDNQKYLDYLKILKDLK